MNKHLRQAINECRPGFHLAMVVRNGSVVSIAANQRRGLAGPQISEKSWRAAHIHAEQAAITMAGNLASGATLIVVRKTKAGNILLSKPCCRCGSAIARAGIKRVVHS
jgi:pyrimidine deaminase RibD-like protein